MAWGPLRWFLWGVAWLMSLVSLGLDVAGMGRRRGRRFRVRNAGGLVMFTGVLIELFIARPARLWVGVLGFVLVVGGALAFLAAISSGRRR